ncbi:DUF4214 domain-containing protein [uncultured Bradyrhizobium sp.]|jgi:probable HAF family extracellular repeat protein|uniref:DUF4214 domain-containing protein n=1 Tax=uncultured Bradyrhizobium sp. TaxID=199684 RepID=UPI00261C483F|nr:DUF4214 domain-containing protein [uncultured Bradyrhizobium sp.]
MATLKFKTLASPSSDNTSIEGENNLGQLVGYYILNQTTEHDFIDTAGSFVDLPYPSNAFAILPDGINSSGTVVGKYETKDGVNHGFVYTTSHGYTVVDYSASGSTELHGINDNGLAVGVYNGGEASFTYDTATGKFTTLSKPNQSTIEIIAHGINSNGQIVGEYSDGNYHGFIYSNGTYITLDDPNASAATGGTQASAINSAGQVVGDYFDSSGGIHGFLWINGVFQTIDDPLAVLKDGGTVPTGINDSGQIVGFYSDDTGRHGFVATTGSSSTAPSISISDAPLIRETAFGTEVAVFTVNLSSLSQDTITVSFNTQDGTAHAGIDYTASTGVLTFAPGQTSATISIPIIGHLLSQPSATFNVDLSNPVDTAGSSTPTIARAVATGTIGQAQYQLHFTFAQSADSSGHIQQGTLIADIYENGKLLYEQPAQSASCDDAFPLLSGTNVPLDTPPTKISSGNLGLVFLIDGIRAGSNQTSVEIHVGTVPLKGQFSYNSQSCLVVSQKFFLTPLENELQAIANAQNPSAPQPIDLSSWINANVVCSIDSSVTGLSQPTLNISGTTGNSFVFSLSRQIEKDVKVLYKISNGSSETIREAIISADTSTTTVSLSQLLTDLSSSGVDPYLSFSNSIKQADYTSHYNKALAAPTVGGTYTATIIGYEVNYESLTGAPKYWYFDGKPNDTSTQIDNESLMFGNTETATIQYKSPQSVAQALSSPNPADNSLAIADTSSNVFAKIDPLGASQFAVASIQLTDSSTPFIQLSSSQFQADHGAIEKIISAFNLEISLGSGVSSIAAPTNAPVSSLGGNDVILGDGHHDQVTFTSASVAFGVQSASGSVTLSGNPNAPNFQLQNVEFLTFADKTMFVENADDANIARLYSAALGRAPDIAGQSAWEDIYANNISPTVKAQGVYISLAQTTIGGLSIAGGFAQAPEFLNKYGNLDDAGFVTQLYLNVLDRTPSQAEVTAWVNNIHNGETRDMVLVGFAESPENIAKTAADWLIQV